jgi:hypothetical protein
VLDAATPAAQRRREIKEKNNMRIARKLMLLAVMAIAATALAAPSAFAQSEPLAHDQTPNVRVFQEVAGVDPVCPAVSPASPPGSGTFATSGGCRVHASAPNVVLRAHVFGVESVDSTCNVEFDMRVDGAGEGYLTHHEFTQGTQGTCERRACDQSEAPPFPPTPGVAQSEGRPWRYHGHEEGPGNEVVTALFCIQERSELNGPRTHCEVSLALTSPTLHRPRVTGNDSACHGTAGFRGEVTGVFNVEAVPGTTGEGQLEQQVEILHP